MTAREQVAAWVRTMSASGAGLLPPNGWQFASLDPSRSRRAAVLILLGEQDGTASAPTPQGFCPRGNADHQGLDLLFVMRAASLSNHPGQVAFPGGAIDPEDADEAAAALREAHEETGLEPSGVEILGLLPEVGLPISNFMVTPVLAWWSRQSPVRAVDTAESEQVFRCSVASLLAGPNRRTAVVRRAGTVSRTPAFITPDAIIWGFTAMLLDAMFEGLGWTEPWDASLEIPAPL
jgi:8-oxo-dGTP pyrophosphatase MutT (NUDIX family)